VDEETQRLVRETIQLERLRRGLDYPDLERMTNESRHRLRNMFKLHQPVTAVNESVVEKVRKAFAMPAGWPYVRTGIAETLAPYAPGHQIRVIGERPVGAPDTVQILPGSLGRDASAVYVPDESLRPLAKLRDLLVYIPDTGIVPEALHIVVVDARYIPRYIVYEPSAPDSYVLKANRDAPNEPTAGVPVAGLVVAVVRHGGGEIAVDENGFKL
jgi:hypothetical protein